MCKCNCVCVCVDSCDSTHVNGRVGECPYKYECMIVCEWMGLFEHVDVGV